MLLLVKGAGKGSSTLAAYTMFLPLNTYSLKGGLPKDSVGGEAWARYLLPLSRSMKNQTDKAMPRTENGPSIRAREAW